MSRLGFLCDEEHRAKTVETVSDICALPGLEHEGIFTHFADADGSEEFTMQQFTCFLELLKALEERDSRSPCVTVRPVRPHCATRAPTWIWSGLASLFTGTILLRSARGWTARAWSR